ncbi:MAG TPA: sensor histidine kinase [Usitatibacter sp.]|nr:sensor histidine kinase [Usitatibacter sp.]
MLQGWIIVAASFAYIGLLFAIAWYGDKRAEQGRSVIANPWIYSLSLAVYATAWTFYGSVGRAASDGVGFLPIYLGPTLMLVLWWFVVRKMIRIAKANRITSLADFVASRYGKSALLGGLVTVVAVVGIVPYISLQLKAISGSFNLLMQYPRTVVPARAGAETFLQDTAFYVALILALFTIAFGTRKLDAAERHEGMVAAVAFESIVKLVAFLAVGIYVTYGMFDGFADVFARAAARPELRDLMTPFTNAARHADWSWMTLLSMLAIVCLPRQFQVAVIENVDEKHLARAVWLFPLYMLLINLFVLPIAFGGLLHFAGTRVDADTFVLTLPMSQHREGLALLVFLGGLSAATGMVIVETIALSTMVCNDLVMPVLLRLTHYNFRERKDFPALLLDIRRGAIVTILMLGYLYFVVAGDAYALVSTGLISFAAAAQFGPVLLGGLYWKGATRAGALAGLSGGFAVWAYTALLPAVAKSGWAATDLLANGPRGIEWLKPTQLFGLHISDPTSHAMLWSMIVNVGLYVGVSVFSRAGTIEAAQAAHFVDAYTETAEPGPAWHGAKSVEALQAVVARFLGAGRSAELFAAYAKSRGHADAAALAADADLVRFAELQLAGTIGAASARTMVATARDADALRHRAGDEASQVIAYSHQLEEKQRELEAATAGLRAANERLQELDRLKDDFISTVTHELRTPLTSIRAFSEILHDNPQLDEAERHRFLGLVIKESERLTRLINQVLDLAKLESGVAEWHTEEIDLAEIVREAENATAPLFRSKSIAVETVVGEVPPRVMADRDRLMQVMLNLLSNAVKFCPERGGRVQVRVVRAGAEARVDVRDNGPGISPEHQKVIFEKFRQVGDTLTQKPAGSGLGLTICSQIIGHFGGRLWVRSAPGHGSEFSFALPAVVAVPRAAASA